MADSNGTCAVSGLPILWGEKAIGLFGFTNRYGYNDNVNGPWDLLPLFVSGTYNADRHTLEDTESKFSDLILNFFKKHAVERSQGFRLPAEETDTFTLQSIVDRISEFNLHIQRPVLSGDKLPDQTKSPREVTLFLIRTDVFDQIIKNAVFENYYTGNQRLSIDSIMESFDDLVAEFENDITYNYSMCFGVDFEPGGVLYDYKKDRSDDNYRPDSLDLKKHIACKLLAPSMGNGCDTYAGPDLFIGDVREKHRNSFQTPEALGELKDIFTNHLQFLFLQIFMARINKHWTVPRYCGQNNETAYHRMLANIILKSSDVIGDQSSDDE